MTYKATFTHLRIFIGFLTVLGLGTAIAGVVMHSALPVVVGLLVLAYLCGARYLRSITLTDDGIEFKGIIRHWSLNWQDIRHLKKLKEYGWPIDRMFGEFTYEIQTDHGRRIVSFLFFHGDCLTRIKEKIRIKQTAPADRDKFGSR